MRDQSSCDDSIVVEDTIVLLFNYEGYDDKEIFRNDMTMQTKNTDAFSLDEYDLPSYSSFDSEKSLIPSSIHLYHYDSSDNTNTKNDNRIVTTEDSHYFKHTCSLTTTDDTSSDQSFNFNDSFGKTRNEEVKERTMRPTSSFSSNSNDDGDYGDDDEDYHQREFYGHYNDRVDEDDIESMSSDFFTESVELNSYCYPQYVGNNHAYTSGVIDKENNLSQFGENSTIDSTITTRITNDEHSPELNQLPIRNIHIFLTESVELNSYHSLDDNYQNAYRARDDYYYDYNNYSNSINNDNRGLKYEACGFEVDEFLIAGKNLCEGCYSLVSNTLAVSRHDLKIHSCEKVSQFFTEK